MTPEIISIIAVGVALAGLMLVSNRENARALRAEIKDVRTEIRAEREETNQRFEAVRAEIKAGIKGLREETSKQFEAVHAGIRAEREETSKQFDSVRAEIAALRADMAELRERMARVEGMFEGLLRREPEPAAA